MGIFVGGSAVSGPAGMAEAQGSMEWFVFEEAGEAGIDLALAFVQFEGAAVHHRDASAIVAAVLEAAKPLQDDRGGLAFAEISYNSAHRFNIEE